MRPCVQTLVIRKTLSRRPLILAQPTSDLPRLYFQQQSENVTPPSIARIVISTAVCRPRGAKVMAA